MRVRARLCCVTCDHQHQPGAIPVCSNPDSALFGQHAPDRFGCVLHSVVDENLSPNDEDGTITITTEQYDSLCRAAWNNK